MPGALAPWIPPWILESMDVEPHKELSQEISSKKFSLWKNDGDMLNLNQSSIAKKLLWGLEPALPPLLLSTLNSIIGFSISCSACTL
ncbi:hypothetical protein CsSME_00020885 [Camellia sinensis var. sinensis]